MKKLELVRITIHINSILFRDEYGMYSTRDELKRKFPLLCLCETLRVSLGSV